VISTFRRFVSLLLAAALPAFSAPPTKPAESPVASTAPAKRARVVLVGWDGADWKYLDPLLEAGALPNLAALIARGRTWNLGTYQPMASPLVWTTVATGRTPVDHGVTDFQELDPKTGVRLPISGRSRRVPAIWNLASAKGLTVGVVGWWATWPAEKVNGFLVSDRAAPVLFDPESLARSPAIAWPEGLGDGVRMIGRREGSPPYEDVAKALRVSRAEFDAAVAAKKDLADPITGFRKILGVTRTIARIGLELYDRSDLDLFMVYFQGTDEVGHVLGRYEPPKLPAVSEQDFAKYKDGVAAIYVEADRILGDIAARAAKNGATLILASDHGFRHGAARPDLSTGIQLDTAYLWHEPPGILAAAGPGVIPSLVRGKASVFDLAPTLCRLLGLPGDPAFEGKLVPGFTGRPAVPAASWAKAAPVERLVPATTAATEKDEKKAADEFTKQLISLGYLTGAEASAVDARPASRAGTETAGSFQNVGTFLRDRGKPAEAVGWYRKALEVNPKSATAWMNLATALHQTGKYDESDDALLAALVNGYHDPEATVYRRVKLYTDAKGKDQRPQLVSFLKKVAAAYPKEDRYRASLGKALFEAGDCANARPLFEELSSRPAPEAENLNLLALTSWCLGDLARAKAAFERSLAINPNQPVVREGLATVEKGRPMR
jgi:Flp pilus assembly protein TadD/predicted AlkP superfamily pyrophosphatase or phosphodiesterase